MSQPRAITNLLYRSGFGDGSTSDVSGTGSVGDAGRVLQVENRRLHFAVALTDISIAEVVLHSGPSAFVRVDQDEEYSFAVEMGVNQTPPGGHQLRIQWYTGDGVTLVDTAYEFGSIIGSQDLYQQTRTMSAIAPHGSALARCSVIANFSTIEDEVFDVFLDNAAFAEGDYVIPFDGYFTIASWDGIPYQSLSRLEGPSDLATRIYAQVAPAVPDDEALGWPMLHFITAWVRVSQFLYDIVREKDDEPGWAVILDPDNAPAVFLDWLSQLVGSRPIAGETTGQARERIKGLTGLRRGSIQAATAAAKSGLIGNQFVIFVERYQDSAWKTAIRTREDETPDPAMVERKIREQKPGGILLSYETFGSLTYDTLNVFYSSYQAIMDDPDYLTYYNIMTSDPS